MKKHGGKVYDMKQSTPSFLGWYQEIYVRVYASSLKKNGETEASIFQIA